ncbi:MAG: S8 family peptidase, partial [Actinomycetota bacterium]|nr:S8 family peptidase [Actinomycetota bacterium]
AEPEPAPRVVVAVIDSPANPYHQWYHAGGPLYPDSAPSSVTPDVLAEFGIDEDHIIRLTRTGNFAADFAQDRAQFDAIRRGEPYWFEGTNVIGISFNANDRARLRPDSGGTHGVGTTSAVLAANPDAIVVSVESPFAPLGVPGYGTAPLGEAWAFSHPAVDIISTSYGPPGSPPFGYHLTDSYAGVVTRGKIHVGASDNSPALSPVDATSGPWWTIGVAGYGEGSSEGRTVTSGSLPDVVGDFTQTLPYCRSCETGTSNVSGTSFATPRTAGTLSSVLLESRRAAGHLRGIVTEGVDRPLMVAGETLRFTNWKIRRALEEAAYYPTLGEYRPGADAPVLDPAPWTTTGWGAVSPAPSRRVVAEALAHLGVAGTPTRSKDAATCAFMTANILARHAWWDRVGPFSQSAGATSDPYEYC